MPGTFARYRFTRVVLDLNRLANLYKIVPPSWTTPAIISIRPISGAAGINDMITGTGFSAAIANESAFFNGKSASILSASTTQLVVVVPALAGTGDVSVDVSGQKVTGPLFTFSRSEWQFLCLGGKPVRCQKEQPKRRRFFLCLQHVARLMNITT